MLTNTKNSEKGKNRNSDDIQAGVVVKESEVRRSPEGSRIHRHLFLSDLSFKP
jgi:hypothetical protein